MKYLGIDFGLKNLGLAIATTPLVEPLGQKKYQTETEAINYLLRVIKEQKIDGLVFGLPEGRLSGTVKAFAAKLNSLTRLPIFFQDETLSTYEAKAKLIQAHASQKKRRQDHCIAATLILQDYLDSINYV